MRDGLELLADIRKRVVEARMLCKVFPERRGRICVEVCQLVELACATVRIMEENNASMRNPSF